MLPHGPAGHAGEWDQTARRPSPRHRVIALDQRGHGVGERHPQDVYRDASVTDAIALPDQLALRRAVLVGQSLGGHTAMLTAAARPERVRALVLVEAGPGSPNPNAPAEIGSWLDSWPTPFIRLQPAPRPSAATGSSPTPTCVSPDRNNLRTSRAQQLSPRTCHP
ncbi:alpha/beta fold hydrolase [Streptomyces sp. NPDC056663]|uniref:alpha/beta fold hydrolase n=1 Tax=Streptomyces sp. NPDC056663 TaxID=3345899 RepID=UPI003688394E